MTIKTPGRIDSARFDLRSDRCLMTPRREHSKGDLPPGNSMRKRQMPPPACPQEPSPGWARVPLREPMSWRKGLEGNPEKTLPSVSRQAPIVGRPGPQVPQFGTPAKRVYLGQRKLWKLPRCGNRGKPTPLGAHRFRSGGLSTVPTASAAGHLPRNLFFGTALPLPLEKRNQRLPLQSGEQPFIEQKTNTFRFLPNLHSY